ncbi:retinol dehydrogenase 11-like isoform X2 [Zootermopsis nevadensis]|uniref:retinol dehydrogenase 11-like isoform X2 n=1 Tax=Zootermopsis nevadensis TaxID=136037 RepID=UPI000B8E7876|nr:retinol dehydrogenase 11-like isoform X2 [Zootermopsis nevadensis]
MGGLLKPVLRVILGPTISDYLFWIMVFGLIGLKAYLKWTTGTCKSMKRIIGKTVIITGANSGIGKETAVALAFRGGKVILACRDVEKGQIVCDEIIKRTENTKVEVQHLDLSSPASIRKFANNIINTEPRVDILINNAGATGLGNKKTEDNLQIGMQVNHFGPFLLTCLLVGKMKKSAPSRIIMVSSLLHHCAKFDIDNLNCEKKFNESQVYFCSKLANMMIANELAKKLKGTGVTVNCVHPGLVYTRTWNYLPGLLQPIFKFILKMFFKSEREAAQTSIFLAVDKDLDDVTGQFFCDCQVVTPSHKALNEGLAKKVWEKTEALVGLKPAEKDF